MEMYRSTRVRNKASSNLRMKASSLYFLNDISNIDSVDVPISSENWRDSYNFNPMIIGRGHFSKVYKVKCCSTGNNAAIKIIRRRRMGTDRIDEIMQEIEIMQLLNKSSNSGFVQLLKVHTSPSEVAIVMEFASGGSLYHVTQDSQTGLPEVYVKIVLSKILTALSIIHRHDIVHLDIKADNILLRYPYQSTDVVLIDFGLARRLTKTKVHKELIGTPDYIAPEVLNYEQICLKSDMWSMGVLTYFLLTNISPFSGETKEDTLHRVTKTDYKFLGHLQEDNMLSARNFISRLLVKTIDDRLSADECLAHEFLADIPVMECPPERSPGPDAPIIKLDYQVRVRQNTNYQTRGLVMSQYDICSSDMNDQDCLPSVDGLGTTASADNLDIRGISERLQEITSSDHAENAIILCPSQTERGISLENHLDEPRYTNYHRKDVVMSQCDNCSSNVYDEDLVQSGNDIIKTASDDHLDSKSISECRQDERVNQKDSSKVSEDIADETVDSAIDIVEVFPTKPLDSRGVSESSQNEKDCTIISVDSPVTSITKLYHRDNVRQNTNYQTRDQVRSQYVNCSSNTDKDSSFYNVNEILKATSADQLNRSEILEYIPDEPINPAISCHSIDQGNDDQDIGGRVIDEDEILEDSANKMHIDMLICQIVEASHLDHQSDNNIDSYDRCYECAAPVVSSVDGYLGNNPDSIASVPCDGIVAADEIITTSEISQNQPVEHYSENHDHFAKTTIRESRRRLMPPVNESFRNSRDNLIDVKDNREPGLPVSKYSTLDSLGNNSVNPRAMNGEHKRLHITRSLKRDFDKPSVFYDKWKRKSQIEPIIPNNWDLNHREHSHSFATSNPVMAVESKKHPNLKHSQTTPEPKSSPKKTWHRVLSNFKLKSQDKSKPSCVIS